MELSQFKTVEQLAAAIKTLDMVTAVPWTDYGGTSTINGWTSFTTNQILYKKIGKLVFVNFFIEGVSDDTVVNFTVPYTTIGTCNVSLIIRRMDDSTTAVGLMTLSGSNNVVNCYPAVTGGTWTNSGNKKVYGQFWYEAA
jgi:hypothetical protein